MDATYKTHRHRNVFNFCFSFDTSNKTQTHLIFIFRVAFAFIIKSDSKICSLMSIRFHNQIRPQNMLIMIFSGSGLPSIRWTIFSNRYSSVFKIIHKELKRKYWNLHHICAMRRNSWMQKKAKSANDSKSVEIKSIEIKSASLSFIKKKKKNELRRREIHVPHCLRFYDQRSTQNILINEFFSNCAATVIQRILSRNPAKSSSSCWTKPIWSWPLAITVGIWPCWVSCAAPTALSFVWRPRYRPRGNSSCGKCCISPNARPSAPAATGPTSSTGSTPRPAGAVALSWTRHIWSTTWPASPRRRPGNGPKNRIRHIAASSSSAIDRWGLPSPSGSDASSTTAS